MFICRRVLIVFAIGVTSALKAQDTLIMRHDSIPEISNPKPDRYVLTQSAFSIRKKSIQFTNAVLLYNRFDVGITSFLSAHAGFVIFAPSLPFSIGFKLSTPRKKGAFIRAAAGCVYMNDFNRNANNGLLAPYGSVTFGGTDHNATISTGVLFSTFNEEVKYYSLSAMHRFTKRWYALFDLCLFTERNRVSLRPAPGNPSGSSAYIINEVFAPMIGVRYAWKKISADITILPPVKGNGIPFPLPVFTVTWIP